ncbi:MAG: peptide chain release factor N(5)-glutamine methyltransferase [Planctomycetota bacterium]
MTKGWKVLDLINATKAFFEKKGIVDTARLDAELLLADVLGCERIELYVRFDEEVAEPRLSEFRDMVRRRGERRPVAHILGRCEFFSREFELTPDVMVPRPETETLVKLTLAELAQGPLTLADIGTGSGVIAVTIALARPEATVYATDISEPALAVARRNVEKHQVADRVELLAGDLVEPLAERGLETALDAVVSNPPYVGGSERERLAPEVTEHEPAVALFSGADGTEHTTRLLAAAPAFLKPGGLLALELNEFTADRIRAAAEDIDALDAVRIERDLRGADRVLLARRKE